MNSDTSAIRGALNRWKIGLVLGLILLLGLMISPILLVSKAMDSEERAEAELKIANQAELDLETLLSEVKDCESGLYGYLATESPVNVSPIETSKTRIAETFVKVKQGLAELGFPDDGELNQLRESISLKNSEMDRAVGLMGAGAVDEAKTLVINGRGKALMDDIRSSVDSLSSSLGEKRNELTRKSIAADFTTRKMNLIGGFLAFPFIALLFFLAWKAVHGAYRDKEQKAKAAAELEWAVENRTRELKTAKDELQAFSYSVSHDLRGPLRAVISYAGMLEEDYGEKLDPEAKDYIDRIKASGRRMSELIDTLLALSRLSRAETSIEANDVSEIALGILRDLEKADPHENRTYEVEPGIVVNADRKMLITLLDNLLRNAWKFSSRAANPKIEVFSPGDHRLVAVRDNGVGFNPEYANKLFLPFQRLHNEREFEGTGIGLAIVHQIVKRHGGHIWAESEEGEGATFYFELEPMTSMFPKPSVDAAAIR
jgi:signal transduction histidine kinase